MEGEMPKGRAQRQMENGHQMDQTENKDLQLHTLRNKEQSRGVLERVYRVGTAPMCTVETEWD